MTSRSRGWCTPRSCAAPSPGAGSCTWTSARPAGRAGVIAVFTAAELNSPGPHSGAGRGADQTPRRVLADGDVRYVGEPIVMVDRRVPVSGRGRRRAGQRGHRAGHPGGHHGAGAGRGRPAGAPGAAGQPGRRRPGRGQCPSWTRSSRTRRTCSPRPSTSTATCDVPMETRGLVAEWDQWAEKLDVIFACQGVHVPRAFLSRMLGLPEDDIRVVMNDVGGAFGQKISPQREDQAVVVAAVLLGDRPVKWIEDRAENLISGGHAREESLADHRGHRREWRAAGREGPPHRERGRLPGGEQRPDGGGCRLGCSPGPITGPGPARWRIPARRCTRTPAGTAPTGGRG